MFPLNQIQHLRIFDMHVHIGPEIVPRRYNATRLADELQEYHMGAVVKHHFIPTTYLVAGMAQPEVLTGSVTLNTFTGGIHPDAIRNALSGLRADTQQPHPDHQRIMVWMPTISAQAHLEYYGRDLDPAWGVPAEYSCQAKAARSLGVLADDGGLSPSTEAVLREIATHDLVLGTGHLSRREIMALVPRAVELGVKRIIITHAWFPPSGLSLDDQVALSRWPGVFIEHSWFVSKVDHVPMARYAQSIAAVGPEKTVLTTDGGQMVSAPLSQAWCHFVAELQDEGVTLSDIVCMASENPHRLLFGDSL